MSCQGSKLDHNIPAQSSPSTRGGVGLLKRAVRSHRHTFPLHKRSPGLLENAAERQWLDLALHVELFKPSKSGVQKMLLPILVVLKITRQPLTAIGWQWTDFASLVKKILLFLIGSADVLGFTELTCGGRGLLRIGAFPEVQELRLSWDIYQPIWATRKMGSWNSNHSGQSGALFIPGP